MTCPPHGPARVTRERCHGHPVAFGSHGPPRPAPVGARLAQTSCQARPAERFKSSKADVPVESHRGSRAEARPTHPVRGDGEVVPTEGNAAGRARFRGSRVACVQVWPSAFIWQHRPKPAGRGRGAELLEGVRYHGDPTITAWGLPWTTAVVAGTLRRALLWARPPSVSHPLTRSAPRRLSRRPALPALTAGFALLIS